LFGSDRIRTEALSFCFDVFSSREPVSTSLENATVRRADRNYSNTISNSRYAFAIPRHDMPEVCISFVPRKKREQGMPGARCTRGLACKCTQQNAHEHTGSAETLRHSLRNGFTAYAALSP